MYRLLYFVAPFALTGLAVREAYMHFYR